MFPGGWEWLIVLAIVLVLFGGRGKLSQLMGDFGKGLKSFKKNLKGDEATEEGKQPAIERNEAEPLASAERDTVARDTVAKG